MWHQHLDTTVSELAAYYFGETDDRASTRRFEAAIEAVAGWEGDR